MGSDAYSAMGLGKLESKDQEDRIKEFVAVCSDADCEYQPDSWILRMLRALYQVRGIVSSFIRNI